MGKGKAPGVGPGGVDPSQLAREAAKKVKGKRKPNATEKKTSQAAQRAMEVKVEPGSVKARAKKFDDQRKARLEAKKGPPPKPPTDKGRPVAPPRPERSAAEVAKQRTAKTKTSPLVAGLKGLPKKPTKPDVIKAIKNITDAVFGPELQAALKATGKVETSKNPIVMAQIKGIIPEVLSNYVQKMAMTSNPITEEGLKAAINAGNFKKALIKEYDFNPAQAEKFFNDYHTMIENLLGL